MRSTNCREELLDLSDGVGGFSLKPWAYRAAAKVKQAEIKTQIQILTGEKPRSRRFQSRYDAQLQRLTAGDPVKVLEFEKALIARLMRVDGRVKQVLSQWVAEAGGDPTCQM